MKKLWLIAPILWCGAAQASPCAWVREDIARAAQHELATHPRIVPYCEACGDPAPGEPRLARGLAVARVDDVSEGSGLYELRVAGAAIDLGSTYVQTGPGRYENLAMLAGCWMGAATPSLRGEIQPGGGELITPDGTPVMRVAPPGPAEVAPAPRPPPAEVDRLVFVEVHPWLWLAGGIGIAACGFFGLVLVLGRRRRVTAGLPRALHLPDRPDRH